MPGPEVTTVTELEDQLRSAMHAAVDHAEPPDGLAWAVLRRHRRHVLRVAAVAAAVIALLVAVPLAFVVGRRPGSPPASGGAGHHHRASSRTTLRGMAARSVPQLLLSGPRPAYYNPDTRRSVPVAGLPRAGLGYSFTRIAGGWLAEPIASAPACCAGPSLPLYYLADGSRTAVAAGSGYSTAAASSAGEQWLLSYPDRARRLAKAAASARLTLLTGRPAGPKVTLPAGYQIARAVGPDLLLAPAIKLPLPVRDELWDPAARRVVRYVTGVVAANQAEVAWEPACPGCAVHVLNVLTGATFSVQLPTYAWAYRGTFSADGRYLAMALALRGSPRGQVVRAGLAVIDIDRRALQELPGTAIDAAGWQPGGDQLIAALTQGNSLREQWIQIATWRPGAAAMRVATVLIPGGRWVVLGDRS
jgi:hypothetical protein